jgi:hypothetical protein
MPSTQSSMADCVNLFALPGIHVFAAVKTWMAGTARP